MRATGRHSAGILLFRGAAAAPEVLLAHPGGPFWARRDRGAWSIPKGELNPGEDAWEAARREFHEEMGAVLPAGFDEALDLGEVRQAGGKRVSGFAIRGEFDPARLVSNVVRFEWPRRSGRMTEFPEVDRAGWFGVEAAREKILAGQLPFIDRLLGVLRGVA